MTALRCNLRPFQGLSNVRKPVASHPPITSMARSHGAGSGRWSEIDVTRPPYDHLFAQSESSGWRDHDNRSARVDSWDIGDGYLVPNREQTGKIGRLDINEICAT